MRWNLHGVVIEGVATSQALRDRWSEIFASCPTAVASPDIRFTLGVGATPPVAPPGEPHFRQGDLLQYFLRGGAVIAHFPRHGELRLDLTRATTSGTLAPATWETSGVLEDLVAVGLSAHLRRRNLFLVHAFAAVRHGRAALLVGGIGAGKTTTGIALLDAGWKLLSNDSPIISDSGEVLSYPGLLAAFPHTFARFARTAAWIPRSPAPPTGPAKTLLAAESVWEDVWGTRAPAGAILFPRIESVRDHALTPLDPPEALRRILPHAVERWDRAMIPRHLEILRTLVESAPAFRLALSPKIRTLPAIVAEALDQI